MKRPYIYRVPHAAVGAGSAATHDVPDYAIVAGSTAKVTRHLEKERFPKEQITEL